MVHVVVKYQTPHIGLLTTLENPELRRTKILLERLILLVLTLSEQIQIWTCERQESSISVAVVVGTFRAFEALLLLARHSLVDHWMELLLFPAMAISACAQLGTTLLIASDKGPALPIKTQLHLVVKQVRPPPEVLEIMGIEALGLVMLVIKGAPLSLEVEHVEVVVVV